MQTALRSALARCALPATRRPCALRASLALPRGLTVCSASMAGGQPLTLNEALRAGRAALAGLEPLTLVLGNEAADMDSIACACAYAALLRAEGDAGAVALVSVPRADLRLRTDAAWLLERQGVDTAALVFSDELDVRALRASGRLQRAVLVDHNRLASSMDEQLAPVVARIVDHHVDEGMYATAQRDIQLVGSCATLVAEHISARAPALLEDQALSTLLLGAVLLDTGNLSGSSGRVTPQDKAAVALLSRHTAGEACDTLCEALRSKRFDQSGLSTLDLLRRDYKEWVMNGWRVGVSSIGLPLAEVVGRAHDPAAAALASWRATQQLDFLVVMSSHGIGSLFTRELGLTAEGDAAVALLPELLALDPLPLPPPGWPLPGAAYVQRDVKASRKVVQPLLVQFFDEHEKQ